MDNLGSHRGKAVRKAIRAAAARVLFLPKYSPDRKRRLRATSLDQLA
jgi:transposase